jgi:gas vesicle protein
MSMESFLIGLMVGVLIGRAFDVWVDWKYKK